MTSGWARPWTRVHPVRAAHVRGHVCISVRARGACAHVFTQGMCVCGRMRVYACVRTYTCVCVREWARPGVRVYTRALPLREHPRAPPGTRFINEDNTRRARLLFLVPASALDSFVELKYLI